MLNKMGFLLLLAASFALPSLSGAEEKISIKVNEDNKYFLCRDDVLQYRSHYRDGGFYRYIAHKTRDGGVSYKKEFLDSLGLQSRNTVYCHDKDAEAFDGLLKMARTYIDESYSLKNSLCFAKGSDMNNGTRVIDWGYQGKCGSVGPIVCALKKQKVYALEESIRNWFGTKCDGQ